MIPGTGAWWDFRYRTFRNPAYSNGLHHFSWDKKVQRVEDGMYGKVIDRTALTATIKMADGSTEVIEQFTKDYVCLIARKQ